MHHWRKAMKWAPYACAKYIWGVSQASSMAARPLHLTLLSMGVLMVGLLLVHQGAGATTWEVAIDGSGDYSSVEAALDDWRNVTDGDVLLIAPGRYNASATLNVNRELTLQGTGPANATVLDGGGAGDVLLVEADNVTLTNLTLQGSRNESPYAGVHGRNGQRLLLEDLVLSENYLGLYLEGTNHTRLENVTLTKNGQGGLLLVSHYNTFVNTKVTENNGTGIKLQGAKHNFFDEVTVTQNPGVNLHYTSLVSADRAFNSTFANVTVDAGSGHLQTYNRFSLSVMDHLGRPIPQMELNLTHGGVSVYLTPAFGGFDNFSDDQGRFPSWFLAGLNHTTEDSRGPVLNLILRSPMGWTPEPIPIGLAQPTTKVVWQPDLIPSISLKGPSNQSLVWPNATVRWQSSDPEDLMVNHTLDWQIDGGTWQQLELGTVKTHQFSNLPRGSNITWRVVADDGNQTRQSEDRTFLVNRLPTVNLLGPLVGHRYITEAPSLTWEGQDDETATLTYRLFLDQETWPVKLRVQGANVTSMVLSSLEGAGGNYSWRVEVEDGLESVSSTVWHFSVNGAPRARIDTVEPRIAKWPHNITLTGSGLDDTAIAAFQWEILGEEVGNATSLTLTNLSHGSHQIDLRVQDEEGIWSDWVHEVAKLYSPPVALAGMDITVGVNEVVYFDSLGSVDLDGEIVQWEWDFDGDGSYDWISQTSSLTTKRYKSAGQYQAVLRVTDNEGYTDTAGRVITVESGNTGSNNGGEGFLPSLSLSFALITMAFLALFSHNGRS